MEMVRRNSQSRSMSLNMPCCGFHDHVILVSSHGFACFHVPCMPCGSMSYGFSPCGSLHVCPCHDGHVIGFISCGSMSGCSMSCGFMTCSRYWFHAMCFHVMGLHVFNFHSCHVVPCHVVSVHGFTIMWVHVMITLRSISCGSMFCSSLPCGFICSRRWFHAMLFPCHGFTCF